jgi:hypothetical protein
MAEKLKIERYKMSHGKQHCDIFLDNLDIATVYEEEYLHLLAASPLMLEALERVLAVYGLPERAITAAIPDVIAAIAAAKGE